MEPENDHPSICCLPDEIIVMILQQNSLREIRRFSVTCKRFNELVMKNNVLWRNIYKKTLPEMLETMKQYGSKKWYKEVKDYYSVKHAIYEGLSNSSSIYYDKFKLEHFVDVCSLLNKFCITKSQNFYYTINILQDMIKMTNRILNTNRSKPPYTLTEMYYAKSALRYYFHAFLSIKWMIMCTQSEKPSPLTVINFFVQWIYNTDLEADDLTDAKITELAEKVDDYLKIGTKGVSVRDPSVRRARSLADSDVLAAVSHVLRRQRHLVSSTETANNMTLDVVKVLENKCGHKIVLLAIYQAVAMKFGVRCELHVFPNHLYIEWRQDWEDPTCRGYVVDMELGSLKLKGGCPFSRNPMNTFRYSHYKLIECLYVEYHRTMGYIKDWHTQNSVFLTELLGMGHDDSDSAYKSIQSALMSHRDYSTAITTPLELKFLPAVHLDLLNCIFTFNVQDRPVYNYERLIGKRHTSDIKYAVGMICTHEKTHFTCVILGWDTRNEYSETFGCVLPQARYFVIDIDKSTRYVAQEYLMDLKQPSRLQHMEDALAHYFTHFDGFRYVPNEKLRAEYPDDDAIATVYQIRRPHLFSE